MSQELLLDYLNNEIKLSKPIKHIEQDFKSGYLFAELLQKNNKLSSDISLYNKSSSEESEILKNFSLLKEDLKKINIHLNDYITKEIISQKKNTAANLVYKIKMELGRQKINFDDIMTKISLFNEREHLIPTTNIFSPNERLPKRLKQNNFSLLNINSNMNGTKSNFVPTPSTTAMGTFYDTSRQRKIGYTKTDFNINDTQRSFKNKKIKLEPISGNNKINNNKNKNIKGESNGFFTNKFNNNNLSDNGNDIDNNTKKYLIDAKDIIHENQFKNKKNNKTSINLNTLDEMRDFSQNNIFLEKKKIKNSGSIDYCMTDETSLNIHNESNKILEEFQDNYKPKFIKYSNLDNNLKNMGANLKEMDPKLKRFTVGGLDSDIIPMNTVIDRFKKKILLEKEEKKNRLEAKKLMTEAQIILQNAIYKHKKECSDNRFSVQLKKGTPAFKMQQYNKILDKVYCKNKTVDKNLFYRPDKSKENINQKSILSNTQGIPNKKKGIEIISKKINPTTINKFFSATSSSIFNQSAEEKFFETLNNQTTSKDFDVDIETKKKRHQKNIDDMKGIMDLIIDFTEKCYRCQRKLKIELIDVPEFKNWTQCFIDGKTCLRIPIKTRRPDSKKEKEKERIEDREKIIIKRNVLRPKTKNELIPYNSDLASLEFNDYLFYRGYWNYKNFLKNENILGTYLQIYSVLGKDITRLTSVDSYLLQNINQNSLLSMKNEEFELKEEEKQNVLIPKSIERNSIFGELVQLNFDNLPHSLGNGNNQPSFIGNTKMSNSFIKLMKQVINITNINMNTINDNSSVDNMNSSRLGTLEDGRKSENESKITTNYDFENQSKFFGASTQLKNNSSTLEIPNTNNNNYNVTDEDFINTNLKNIDFSYIPIKLCIIGHLFSGRKTQADLLCQKFHGIKSYSVSDIINFNVQEYQRLHLPPEKNNSKAKGGKKNAPISPRDQTQREEELKQFEDINRIIEPLALNRISDLSDEAKIYLLVKKIKQDFPVKTENEINEEIIQRNKRKQKLEEELEKLKEEQEKKGSKDSKKPGKNNANGIDPKQQSIINELELVNSESFVGFILVDFPTNIEQYIKIEKIIGGFVQEIDKSPDIRDIYMNVLTSSIDKPYANISNTSQEIINYNSNRAVSGDTKDNNAKRSLFCNYVLLDVNEEKTLERVSDRVKDPVTGIVYHMVSNPPPAGDKKINSRLVPFNEPNEEQVKDNISQFNIEYPKILEFISLFKNLKKVTTLDKNDISKEIEELLSNEIKKFEDRENKDTMGGLANSVMEESDSIKYFKRLRETKKIVSKDISENFISQWFDNQDKYNSGVKNFLLKFYELKNNVLEQVNSTQEEFNDFLNKPSPKYRLVDIFVKKYNYFLERLAMVKDNKLVQEEFAKDLMELTENMWEIIQMRKRDSLDELKFMKDQKFIESQLEQFGNLLIKMIILETNFYINKLNLIRKFYFEFEHIKYSERCPYEYTLNQDDLLNNLNDSPLFVNSDLVNDKKGNSILKTKNKSKKNKQNEKISSPKLEKLFINCFKLFFLYDKAMNELYEKEKTDYEQNSSNSSTSLKKMSIRKKKTGKDQSVFSEIKNLINYDGEMKAAMNHEKNNYKMRILFLKDFGIKILNEIFVIGEKTFNELDNNIIESVDVQNNAMNRLIGKLRESINEGALKIKINYFGEDMIELDNFDIFNILQVKFSQYNLIQGINLANEEKNIDINKLYKIYLDVKTYEIQRNYITVNTLIDIVFKKHMFDLKSNAFMKYFRDLPFFYLQNFINKFIIKTNKGQSLIKINEIFTMLALLNMSPPKVDQQKNILKNINDKLKFHSYLTKDDFMKCKLWFEKIDERDINNENKNDQKNNNNTTNQNETIHNKKDSGHLFDSANKNEDNQNDIDYIGHFNNENNIIKKNQVDALRAALSKKSGLMLHKSQKRLILENFEAGDTKENFEENKSPEDTLKEFLFNINKNEEDQINFIDFMKKIYIRRPHKKTRKMSKDKIELISQQSIADSNDNKTLVSNEPDKYKATINNLANSIMKHIDNYLTNNEKDNKDSKDKENKVPSNFKKIKGLKDKDKGVSFATGVGDTSSMGERSSMFNEANLIEYTYLDLLIKK